MGFWKRLFNSDGVKDQQDPPDLWGSFRGRENTEALLKEKAEFLGPILLHVSSSFSKSFSNESRKHGYEDITDVEVTDISFEFLFFLLHYLDRRAFYYLGGTKRPMFIDTLVIEVCKRFSCTFETVEEAKTFLTSFREKYNERQTEYSHYKNQYPDSDEGCGHTLFWEVAKKMTTVIDAGLDAELLALTMTHIIATLHAYDFDGIFVAQ